MEDGAEFYMIPISLGYFRLPDVLDGGSVYIEHIAECIDAITMKAENQSRLEEWQRSQGR